jgi:hypothetical protein
MGYNTCNTCGERTYNGSCGNCQSTDTYFGSKYGEDYNRYSNSREFLEKGEEANED